MAVTLLAVGGCASAAGTPASSPTADRPAAVEGPTNFASPENLLKRYPTMRRQEL